VRSIRVFIRSFGCSANVSDSEVLAGCLAEAGFQIVDAPELAHVLVYNTCAVKQPTEDKIFHMLKRVPKGKKLVVVGCLPIINFERLSREIRFNAVAGPALGEKIVEIVRKVVDGEQVYALNSATVNKPCLLLPRKRVSSIIGIVPISYGCLGSCAYCCVIFARGSLRSYDIEEVVERVKLDIQDGIREIWLTAQDTACYGRDKGATLVDLLDAISAIEGNFYVRVGMMTPNFVIDILDELIEAFRHKRIFKFLHLPVQSGDNEVLKLMKRHYTVEDYKQIVEKFRGRIPEITLSTDIICGFPGETREAFRNSLKLIRETKPDVVNISKFFPRPGTEASKMQEFFVSPSEIKRRSRAMSELAKEMGLLNNRRWVGWRGQILIDEKGKAGSLVGRNYTYKPIVLQEASNELFGKFTHVEVVEATATFLRGKIFSPT